MTITRTVVEEILGSPVSDKNWENAEKFFEKEEEEHAVVAMKTIFGFSASLVEVHNALALWRKMEFPYDLTDVEDLEVLMEDIHYNRRFSKN